MLDKQGNFWLDGDTFIDKNGVRRRVGGADTGEKYKENSPKTPPSVTADLATSYASDKFTDSKATGELDKYERSITTVNPEVTQGLIDTGLAGPTSAESALGAAFRGMEDYPDMSDDDRQLKEIVGNLGGIEEANLDNLTYAAESYPEMKAREYKSGMITRAAKRGWEEEKSMYYNALHAVGHMIDSDGLKEWASENAEVKNITASLIPRNARTLREIYEDEDLPLVDKAQEIVTSGIEFLGEEAIPTAVTAAITYAAVRTGAAIPVAAAMYLSKRGAKKALKHHLGQKLLKEKAKKGAKIGAVVGFGISGLPASIGEAESTAQELGLESGGYASILTGMAAAGVDTFADMRIVKAVLEARGLPKDLSGNVVKRAVIIARNMGVAGAKQAPVGGASELIQEALFLTSAVAQGGDINRLAPDGDVLETISWRLGEAFFAGSVVDGTIAAVGSGINQGVGLLDQRAIEQMNTQSLLGDNAADYTRSLSNPASIPTNNADYGDVTIDTSSFGDMSAIDEEMDRLNNEDDDDDGDDPTPPPPPPDDSDDDTTPPDDSDDSDDSDDNVITPPDDSDDSDDNVITPPDDSDDIVLPPSSDEYDSWIEKSESEKPEADPKDDPPKGDAFGSPDDDQPFAKHNPDQDMGTDGAMSFKIDYTAPTVPTVAFVTAYRDKQPAERETIFRSLLNRAKTIAKKSPALAKEFSKLGATRYEYSPYSSIQSEIASPNSAAPVLQNKTFAAVLSTNPATSKGVRELLKLPKYKALLKLDDADIDAMPPEMLEKVLYSIESKDHTFPIFSEIVNDLTSLFARNKVAKADQTVFDQAKANANRRGYKFKNVGQLKQDIVTAFMSRHLKAHAENFISNYNNYHAETTSDDDKVMHKSELYALLKSTGFKRVEEIVEVLVADDDAQLDDVVPHRINQSNMIHGNFFDKREKRFTKDLDGTPTTYRRPSVAHLYSYVMRNPDNKRIGFTTNEVSTGGNMNAVPAAVVSLAQNFRKNILPIYKRGGRLSNPRMTDFLNSAKTILTNAGVNTAHLGSKEFFKLLASDKALRKFFTPKKGFMPDIISSKAKTQRFLSNSEAPSELVAVFDEFTAHIKPNMDISKVATLAAPTDDSDAPNYLEWFEEATKKFEAQGYTKIPSHTALYQLLSSPKAFDTFLKVAPRVLTEFSKPLSFTDSLGEVITIGYDQTVTETIETVDEKGKEDFYEKKVNPWGFTPAEMSTTPDMSYMAQLSAIEDSALTPDNSAYNAVSKVFESVAAKLNTLLGPRSDSQRKVERHIVDSLYSIDHIASFAERTRKILAEVVKPSAMTTQLGFARLSPKSTEILKTFNLHNQKNVTRDTIIQLAHQLHMPAEILKHLESKTVGHTVQSMAEVVMRYADQVGLIEGLVEQAKRRSQFDEFHSDYGVSVTEVLAKAVLKRTFYRRLLSVLDGGSSSLYAHIPVSRINKIASIKADETVMQQRAAELFKGMVIDLTFKHEPELLFAYRNTDGVEMFAHEIERAKEDKLTTFRETKAWKSLFAHGLRENTDQDHKKLLVRARSFRKKFAHEIDVNDPTSISNFIASYGFEFTDVEHIERNTNHAYDVIDYSVMPPPGIPTPSRKAERANASTPYTIEIGSNHAFTTETIDLRKVIMSSMRHFRGNEASLFAEVYNAFNSISSTFADYRTPSGQYIKQPILVLESLDPDAVLWENPIRAKEAKQSADKNVTEIPAWDFSHQAYDVITVQDLIDYKLERTRLKQIEGVSDRNIGSYETAFTGVAIYTDLASYHHELTTYLAEVEANIVEQKKTLPEKDVDEYAIPMRDAINKAIQFAQDLMDNNSYKYGIPESDRDKISIALQTNDIDFMERYRTNSHNQKFKLEMREFLPRASFDSLSHTGQLHASLKLLMKNEIVLNDSVLMSVLNRLNAVHYQAIMHSTTMKQRALSNIDANTVSRNKPAHDNYEGTPDPKEETEDEIQDRARNKGKKAPATTDQKLGANLGGKTQYVSYTGAPEPEPETPDPDALRKEEKISLKQLVQDMINDNVYFSGNNDVFQHALKIVTRMLGVNFAAGNKVFAFNGELTEKNREDLGEKATAEFDRLYREGDAFSFIQDDIFVVYVPFDANRDNDASDPMRFTQDLTRAIFKLGHEIGHLVFQTLANSSDVNLVKRIHDEYVDEAKGNTTFEEWFADKVARNLHSRELLGTKSGILKKLYEAITYIATTAIDVSAQIMGRITYFTYSENVNQFIENSIRSNDRVNLSDLTNKSFRFFGDKKPLHQHLAELIAKAARSHRSLVKRAEKIHPDLREMFEKHRDIRRVLFSNFTGSLVRPAKLKDHMLRGAYNDILTSTKSPAAQLLNQWMHNMKKRAGNSVHVPKDMFDSVPIRLNTEKMQQDPDAFIRIIRPALVDMQGHALHNAQQVVLNAIDNEGFISNSIPDELGTVKPPRKSMVAKNIFTNTKIVKELAEAGFIDTDVKQVMLRFMNHASNYIAYAEAFGEEVTIDGQKSGTSNPALKLYKIRNLIDKDKISEFIYIHKALTGQLTKTMPVNLRVAQDWLLAASNISVLAFSGVGSVPEIGTPLLRLHSFAQVAKALGNLGAHPLRSYNLAKQIGTISTQFIQQGAMDMYYTGNTMNNAPAWVQKTFFLLNGQTLVMNIAQVVGAGVADSMLREVTKKRSRQNNHLISDYQLDVNKLKIVFDMDDLSNPQTAEEHDAVAHYHDRATLFTTSASLLGERIHQPAMKQNPWVQLYTNLKGYFYEAWQIIIRKTLKETQRRYKESDSLLDIPYVLEPAALTLTILLPLAHLGWELREWMRGGKELPPMGSTEYMTTLVSRAGLMGTAGELIMPYYYADQFHRPYITAAVPAAGYIYDVAKAKNWRVGAKRMSPFINQGVPNKWNPYKKYGKFSIN